jgi:hypothetical protein
LASNALVETLGHVVLDEFLDQVAQMSLAENDELVETLVFDGPLPAQPRRFKLRISAILCKNSSDLFLDTTTEVHRPTKNLNRRFAVRTLCA